MPASVLQRSAVSWLTRTFGPKAMEPAERVSRFLDEAGELGEAYVRTSWQSETVCHPDLKGEIADAYITLLALASAFGVDLDRAAHAKLSELGSRTYEEIDGVWTKVPPPPPAIISEETRPIGSVWTTTEDVANGR